MNTQLLADRYAPSDPIGVGTGSIVRLAVDLRSSAARVAVKIVSGREPPATVREFFLRETAALSRLRHENIIRLLDQGTTDSVGSWLVLEYAWGGSLENPGVRAKYADEPAIVRLLRACASALSHAHLSGVIHRDIKPRRALRRGLRSEARGLQRQPHPGHPARGRPDDAPAPLHRALTRRRSARKGHPPPSARTSTRSA